MQNRNRAGTRPGMVLRTLLRKTVILGVLLLQTVAMADQPVQPYTKVTVSDWGSTYFIMIPEKIYFGGKDYNTKMTDPAHGRAYELFNDGSSRLLWEVSGWYAHQVFLSNSGRYLVRIGNWALGSEPSAGNLAVAFYENGRELARYSTLDLIRDKKSVEQTASHYFWKSHDSSYPRFDPMTGNFLIKTIEKRVAVFNVETGELLEIREP